VISSGQPAKITLAERIERIYSEHGLTYLNQGFFIIQL